jgi:Raf kinase inhibitor-like YbhB/YbcL family protein
MRTVLLAVLLIGCGGDDGATPATTDAAVVVDAAIDAAPPAAFTLTSPTISEAGVIPLAHVCTNRGGMNLSPALTFANVPAGTQSFVVTLTDLSNGLVHCAIYDVPASATGLPADVDKVYAPPDVAGAHQPNAYTNMRGWAGPCPSTKHTYQLKAYALATATLPGAMMNTTKDQVVTAAATNLGTATLTATFTP